MADGRRVFAALMARLQSVRDRAGAIRLGLLERLWGWLRLFPGDSGLAACAVAGVLTYLALRVLGVAVPAWLGPSGVRAVEVLPYMIALAALVIFPGRDPALERVVGVCLTFLVGGAPLTCAYVVLAGAAERGGPACRALWAVAVWVPRKAFQLAFALAGRRPVPLRRGGPLSPAVIALLLVLSGAGLGLRLEAARGSDGPGSPDALEYDALARKLMSGTPLVLDHSVVFRVSPPVPTYANRTPGYPALLAVVYATVGGDPERQWRAAVYLQCLIDVLTGLLLFAALRCLLPNWAALLGAAAWLAYLPAARSAPAFLPESLAAFLLCSLLYLTLASRHPAMWAAGGALSGWAALVRPELVVLPVVMGASAMAMPEMELRRRAGRAGLAVVFFALVLAPWTVRNYRVLGSPVAASTVGGFNFWAGNYLPLRGIIRDESFSLVRDIVHRREIDPASEVAVDRALWREGMSNVSRYLRARPGDYLRLIGSKCLDLWSIPIVFQARPLPPVELPTAFFFALLLGAGVACLNPRLMLPLLAFPVCQTFAHCLTYAHDDLHTRFLLPVMPMLIGLAAVGVGFLAEPVEAILEASPQGADSEIAE